MSVSQPSILHPDICWESPIKDLAARESVEREQIFWGGACAFDLAGGGEVASPS